MIKKIELSDVATFKNAEAFEPNKINYLFGGNGTGKTTLGKVINDCKPFPECKLIWTYNPIKSVVYNKDFVEENFSQSDSIKGIFTLGKGSTDAKKRIEEARKQIDKHEDNVISISEQIETRKNEFKRKALRYIEKVWEVKKRYIEYFKPAYRGHLRSKKSFFKGCLAEIGNESDLLDEKQIKEKCERIFSESLTTYDILNKPDFSRLVDLQGDKLLHEKIIGKSDIEIGKLIEKLNNSDWVKKGLGYLDEANNRCPFCQQHISKSLEAEIKSFFDETYQKKIKQLKNIKEMYERNRVKLIEEIEQITRTDIPIIDFTELLEKKELLEEKNKNNQRTIEYKCENPSVPVTLDSIKQVISNILELIDELNSKIRNNNRVVEHIHQEEKTLKSQIWRFVVEEIEITLKSYLKDREDYSKAFKGLKASLERERKKEKELHGKIEKLESKITSIQHSVNEINKLLKSFGFTNFKLRQVQRKGFYELVRNDGRKVGKTLSEGEYTFITFLYFYHLLKGSTNETGVTKDKIVVIDDPVSSLDSSVLFVVSNLIKSISRDVRNNDNGIRQLFVLTHNVYFFKEVTFRGSRANTWNEESYWLVRKNNNQSNIVEHEENPVKTTYNLLWRELDDPKKVNTATVFNTMRRILEYYFNILGGLDYEKAIEKFDGEEKEICNSLIGWINDGSHFINDDLAVTVDLSDVERYLKVFKDIFYKMDHGKHYEMMMKEGVEYL